MWEIQHSTVDWDCSKTQTLLVTLKTQNRLRREFCHAAAVSSQRSSATWKNNCNSGLLSHGACAPMTFCWLPPGLVEWHFLDESQMQWSSADVDTEPCHAWSPTEDNNNNCPDYSDSGPSSRRQAPVKGESSPEIRDPMPDTRGGVMSEERHDVQESRGAGTRSCASPTNASPAGKEEDGGTSDESGPLPVPKSARVVSGRRDHRLRCAS